MFALRLFVLLSLLVGNDSLVSYNPEKDMILDTTTSRPDLGDMVDTPTQFDGNPPPSQQAEIPSMEPEMPSMEVPPQQFDNGDTPISARPNKDSLTALELDGLLNNNIGSSGAQKERHSRASRYESNS